ncbi:MAG: hypothetical protein AMXMBFR13_13440 [Phycisphaerae bacterium]
MKHVCTATLLTLLLASSSFSQTVVGNWEGADLDNWYANTTWGGNGNATLTPGSTMGVTRDQGSLKVQERMGWAWSLTYDVLWDDRAALMANNTVSMDVTMLPSDWTYAGSGDAWNMLELHMQGDGVANVSLPAVASYNWDPFNQTSSPVTLSWDYSAVRAALASAAATAGKALPDWIQFNLVWNNGGAWSNNDADGAIMYMDNAVVTPEPVSLALLGLSTLSFLRRRRPT